MANGPEIRDNTASEPLGFEPSRLLLADVDGDGLDDLLYIHLGDAVLQVWINQTGNGWSLEPLLVPIPEHLSFVSPDAIRVEDLLGTGTAGVLWTSDRQPGAEDNYQFLDLTAGTKPSLLTEVGTTWARSRAWDTHPRRRSPSRISRTRRRRGGRRWRSRAGRLAR